MNRPSAAEFSAFVSDASQDSTEKLAATAIRHWGGERDCSNANEAAALLTYVYEFVGERWRERFNDDPVYLWIDAQRELHRAWEKALGKRRAKAWEARAPLDRGLLFAQAVERRHIQWVEGRAKGNALYWGLTPFPDSWIVRQAGRLSLEWKWRSGLAQALHDYHYTSRARELVEERRTISLVLNDALQGISAIRRLLGTHLGRALHGDYRLVSGRSLLGIEQFPAAEVLQAIEIESFYPSVRNDGTVKERQLVADLCDLHLALFHAPKPEAIAEILDSSTVRSPLDLRTIERICQDRRSRRREFNAQVAQAKEQQRNK